MTESSQTTNATLYLEIEPYISHRVSEFDRIPSERRQELQQLSDYIRRSHAKGQAANLTFVCTHNSRRSHLTQIWAQIGAAFYGVTNVRTFSGGTEVTACNPRTVDALERCGLRCSTTEELSSNPHYFVTFSESEPALICYSKVFNQAPNPASDYCAIMTCSHADQNCPVAIGCDLRLSIRYEDPKVADDTPEESATYDERCAQIAREMLYGMSMVRT